MLRAALSSRFPQAHLHQCKVSPISHLRRTLRALGPIRPSNAALTRRQSHRWRSLSTSSSASKEPEVTSLRSKEEGSEQKEGDTTAAATKKKVDVHGVRRLYALYAPEKKRLAISLSALTVSTAITMCVPAAMGKVIDVVSLPGGAEQLPGLAGALAVLFGFGAIANVTRVAMTDIIAERIVAKLRETTYKSILSEDLEFFDRNRTGELINRLGADTQLIGKVLGDNMSGGLRSGGQAVGSIGMMFYTCPKLALAMILFTPPAAVGAVTYGRYVKSLSRKVQDALSKATELAEERISNNRTVKWFASEEQEGELYRDRVQQVLKLAQRQALLHGSFFGAVDLSFKLSMLGVLGYGGHMVTQGQMTVGDLTSFLMYTIYVGVSFAGLSSFYADLMKGVGASTRVFDLIERGKLQLGKGGSLPVPDGPGRIKLENVSFRYPTREDAPLFDELNLTIEPSTTVALVGPSGCGKSTVALLVGGLYCLQGPHCKGRVLLDGVDINEIEKVALRRVIGVVPQEPVLFASSIAANIAYGCQGEPSRDEIIEAAMAANAHQFIQRLPEGYDTQVGERGQSLSGGQKQRLAIARALIRKPKILILDEATSALDAESEHLVQEAIERAKVGRTVLMVSHRLSTIKSADYIAMIDQGKVVDQGTFAELTSNPDGPFSQLIRHHDI